MLWPFGCRLFREQTKSSFSLYLGKCGITACTKTYTLKAVLTRLGPVPSSQV